MHQNGKKKQRFSKITLSAFLFKLSMNLLNLLNYLDILACSVFRLYKNPQWHSAYLQENWKCGVNFT